MFRDRDFREVGPNSYVKAMQFADAVNMSQPQQFTLGSPAASNGSLLFAAFVANGALIETDVTGGPITLDSKYGRCLIYTVSGDPGAAGGTIETRGWDYLNQPMLERVSGVSGATAILYGNKAFKRVKSCKLIVAATNAVTYAVGTGTRLGLPYKGDVVWAKENGILVPNYNRADFYWADRAAALAIAGGSVFVQAPFPGYVKTLIGVSYGAGSTNNPVITAKLGGTAITGLTVTIIDNASGRVAGVPSTPGYRANNRFVTNGLIELVGTAAASAAGDTLGVELQPTQFTPPDTTDPGTAITGDPRGTYDPLTAPAGTEVIVGILGDNAVNASNNGGLHGVQHFFA